MQTDQKSRPVPRVVIVGGGFGGLEAAKRLGELRNRFVVALSWAWTYLTFQRGARLVTLQPTSFPGSGGTPLRERAAAPPLRSGEGPG